MPGKPGVKAEQPPSLDAPSPEWIAYIRSTRPVSAANGPLLDGLAGQPEIGSGLLKIVYDLGDNTVLCLIRKNLNKRQLEAVFYARKLVHELMPHFVPDIHSVSDEPPSMIVQKIEGLPADKVRTQLDPDDATGQELVTRKVRGTAYILKQLGVKVSTNEANYIFKGEQPAVYVGGLGWNKLTLDLIYGLLKWYPEPQRSRASGFISQLGELATPPSI